ncbi:hypothetical protein N3K66_008815 [Trichothecium roseum]|uniref:Uncharacterized protein n=1 Tax=Trichothecium roseum TaxID=47278 RepID=A0ACC0UR90_9HYPO|nr:hypothetical protein N3K66_008815 [Trichothecium roseum]
MGYSSPDDSTWGLGSLILPGFPPIIHYICFAFFMIGFLFISPFLILIVFDVCVWIWRTLRCASRRSSQNTTRSIRTNHQPTEDDKPTKPH